jgi:O-antigen ligase
MQTGAGWLVEAYVIISRIMHSAEPPFLRHKLSAHLRRLARLTLGATIILIPFRYRIPFLARPFPPVYQDYTDFLLFASDIFLIATLSLWLLSLALEPRPITRGPLFLSGPIFGLTVMGWVSIPFSVDPSLSAYHALRLIALGGLYLYLLNELTSLPQIIFPVILQVFIQAVIGVAQIIRQHSLGLTSLSELTLDPAWSGVSIVWAEGVRSLRAYGLSDHPNILGGCLAFALILIAAWYADAEARWPGWRTPVGALFALGGLALFFTFSRAAWLGLGSGMALSLALLARTRQTRALVDWFSLLGAALIVVLPFAWQNAAYLGVRLNVGNSFTNVPIENRSIAERETLTAAVNKLFADHALTGVGLGSIPTALRKADPDFPFNYQPAHNVLLNVSTETGMLGALFYLGVLFGPWLALWLRRKQLIFSPAFIGVSGTLLAVTLVGFFDYYTWLLAPGRLWQWLVWGVWGALYQRSSSGVSHD